MQLLGRRAHGLESLDRQVRLRGQRLNASEEIGHVFLLRQYRFQVVRRPCSLFTSPGIR